MKTHTRTPEHMKRRAAKSATLARRNERERKMFVRGAA